MKKKGLVLCIAGMMLSMLAGCAPKTEAPAETKTPEASVQPSQAAGEGSDTLNLFTWDGMFPPEVLEAFTNETGIKVVFSNFDTDETMLAKLEAAKGGDYDLVVADDYIIKTVIEENLAQKLDTSKLSGFGNINPFYQGQFFDPANEYTVPYGAGIQTIVYNPDVVKKEITGYADLWDESLKDSFATIGNYRVVNGMALKVMGESYNTEDVAVIEKAGEELLKMAPNIRLIKDDNLQDDLLSGEVSAAVMYTSQVTAALMNNPDLKVVFPKEGIGFGILASFIPVNAPHSDAAYKFLDYLLRPEVSAKCTEYVGYYSTNKEADALIKEEYRSFLILPDSLGETEMIQPISADAEAAHSKVWTTFKNACGQ